MLLSAAAAAATQQDVNLIGAGLLVSDAIPANLGDAISR